MLKSRKPADPASWKIISSVRLVNIHHPGLFGLLTSVRDLFGPKEVGGWQFAGVVDPLKVRRKAEGITDSKLLSQVQEWPL